MLNHSRDHQIQSYRQCDLDLEEVLGEYMPRELLLGRLVLMVFLVIAILLKSLA